MFIMRTEDPEKNLVSSLRNTWTQAAEALRTLYDNSQARKKEMQAASLANWLPYEAYDEKNQIFVNTDSVGFCLELVPQTGADEEMVQILNGLYSGMPDEAAVTFQLFASPQIGPVARGYGAMRYADARAPDYISPYGRPERNTNPYRELARRRVDHFLKAARQPLAPTVGSLIRNYRLLMSVTLPGSPDNTSRIEELLLLRSGMKSTLRAAGFPSRDWTPSDLINWVADIVNPQRLYREGLWLEYDDLQSIRYQIVDRDTVTTTGENYLKFSKQGVKDHTYIRTFSVKNYPKRFALWEMAQLIGDATQGTIQYPCPFMITLGVYFPNQETSRNYAQMRQIRATTNSESRQARFSPWMKEQKEDWDLVMGAIDRGHNLVEIYHNLVLFSTEDKIEQHEQAAKAVWTTKGFDISCDVYNHQQALQCNLPASFSKSLFLDLKALHRTTTKTTLNAVHLAPVIAEWSGTPTPVLALACRRGQLATFNLFDNTAGNYNAAIAGASGSGKSVFVNDLAASYASVGGRVWIIDVGRSYEHLCETLNGEFIEFTPNKNICLNPFTFVVNINEEMELLQPLIAVMASPKKELDSVTYAYLAQIIKKIWQEKGNKTTITDIYDACKSGKISDDMEQDSRLMDLSTLLYPFSKEGVYGKYFDGEANISFKNDFTVLELEELKSKKDLQSVVLFIMMYRITHEMYLGDRSRWQVVIIDEAWDLLGTMGSSGEGQSSASAQFIEAGYRRARKYAGAFITATQSVTDFNLSPAAQAALKNADWRFLLRQKPEAIDGIKKTGLYDDDPGFIRALQTLRTEKGVFADVLISGPGFRYVTRNYIDPKTLLRFSSDPKDRTDLQRYRDKGLSQTEAEDAVLKDRGLME